MSLSQLDILVTVAFLVRGARHLSNDILLGKDFDPVKQAKKAYEQTGGQPQKSKQRVE
jgi:hypothetical protein